MLVGLIVVGFVLIVIPTIVASLLRNVEAGTIRLVSWLAGGTVIYRGPGKSKEIPLLTTGTTISSKVINIDLDITDQTADVDSGGTPAPIKVRVLASAIVSVGDTDALIKTAANRFFSKSDADQLSTLTDLLSSSGRRAMNLLTHDQLFSAKAAPLHALPPGESTAVVPVRVIPTALVPGEADRDRGRGRSAGRDHSQSVLARVDRPRTHLQFAEHQGRTVGSGRGPTPAVRGGGAGERGHRGGDPNAPRQGSAARGRARDLGQDSASSNKPKQATRRWSRRLKQNGRRRPVFSARPNSMRRRSRRRRPMRRECDSRPRPAADAEAIRIRKIAEAQAEAIQKVNQAIAVGGESYFRYRQIEMLPQIAPVIAAALSDAKMVTISGGGEAGGAATATTNNITSVIQTVLAAQLVSRGLLDNPAPSAPVAAPPPQTDGKQTLPSSFPSSPAKR